MSEEQLKDFLEAVKADAMLQEKLQEATDVDAVVAIAKAAGFVFSAEELKKLRAELSEEELETVAGSGGTVQGMPGGQCCYMTMDPLPSHYNQWSSTPASSSQW